MALFLARRIGSAFLLLAALSALIFVLQTYSPGDPVKAYLGINATPQAVAAQRQAMGLNDPWPMRLSHFIVQLAQGDLGKSYRTRRAVSTDLLAFLPATLELVIVAFAIALGLAVAFAVAAALHWPGRRILAGVMLVLANAPPFLLALTGIVLFYATLNWLPANGRGLEPSAPSGFLLIDTLLSGQPLQWLLALQHLLLPAVVLAVAPALAIGRVLRASLEKTLGADHVRTAHAKGLSPARILLHHVARNSIGPALSMAGLQLGFMFASVVVVEQVFAWPGIGNYLAASIPVSDFPAIAGITLVLGVVYILVNLGVDILQVLADPRQSH